MGRHMQQHDKEHLKMVLLNQEATFKQQVHELHRVYQVQQALMGEMTNTSKKKMTAELPAEECGLELTLGTGSSSSCSSRSRSHQKKKESSSCSDSGSSFSSSSTGFGATKQNHSIGSGQFPIPQIDARFKHEVHGRYEIEERIRKDWFSQCLSLNTT